jgi:hypothetical protein
VERVEREIVSEYGFGGLSQAPDALREFRQVLSVDGKPVRAPGKALQEFARTVSAASDVERRRALQDFERLGLVDPASDFGQMILLFRKQSLGGLHFSYKGAFQFGAEAVDIVYWRQRDTGPAASVYRDKEVVKVRMEGEIWARRSDHLPLRITLALPVLEPLGEAQQTIRHEAAIDYFRSTHGVLLPLTIQYQKRAGGQMLVENRAFYSKYRMFTVDVEIRFSGEENPAVPVQPQ